MLNYYRDWKTKGISHLLADLFNKAPKEKDRWIEEVHVYNLLFKKKKLKPIKWKSKEMSSLRKSILYGGDKISIKENLHGILNFSEIVYKSKNSSKPEKHFTQMDYLRNIDIISMRIVRKLSQ